MDDRVELLEGLVVDPPAAGSQAISPSPALRRRTMRSTSCPPAVKNAASCCPINPEAPVIAMRSGGRAKYGA